MKTLASALDNKAMGLTSEFLKKEAQILVVLQEMFKRNLFPELNYSGVFDYCERRLGLSRAQSYYYKSVIEKSEQVPELKQAVLQGELTLSEARRIAPVITPENKNEWLIKAKTLNQTELERAVKEVNPRAHIPERIRPVAKDVRELRTPINDKTESDIERLKDLLSQVTEEPMAGGVSKGGGYNSTIFKRSPMEASITHKTCASYAPPITGFDTKPLSWDLQLSPVLP